MVSAFTSALLALLHQSAIKYVELVVDGPTISARMTVAPADLTEPLHLAPDAQPTVIDAAQPAAARYVRDWVTITGCTPSDEHAAPDLDGRFVAVTWRVHCSAAPDEIDLDLRAFFAQDAQHEAIVRVGGGEPIVVRASQPRWTIPVEDRPRSRAYWLIPPAIVVVFGGVAIGLRRLRRRAPRT